MKIIDEIFKKYELEQEIELDELEFYSSPLRIAQRREAKKKWAYNKGEDE